MLQPETHHHWPSTHRVPDTRRGSLAQATNASITAPILPATLLALELLLREPCIDLRRVSALVLCDPGATLHTLHLAGCGEQLFRIEECLASLDAGTWFAALSAHALPAGGVSARIVAAWQHARTIAAYARFAAESTDGVPAETAYLVGLFHDIDSLLDASSLRLPRVLRQALVEASEDPASLWHFILHTAHLFSEADKQTTPLIRVSSCGASQTFG